MFALLKIFKMPGMSLVFDAVAEFLEENEAALLDKIEVKIKDEHPKLAAGIRKVAKLGLDGLEAALHAI